MADGVDRDRSSKNFTLGVAEDRGFDDDGYLLVDTINGPTNWAEMETAIFYSLTKSLFIVVILVMVLIKIRGN